MSQPQTRLATPPSDPDLDSELDYDSDTTDLPFAPLVTTINAYELVRTAARARVGFAVCLRIKDVIAICHKMENASEVCSVEIEKLLRNVPRSCLRVEELTNLGNGYFRPSIRSALSELELFPFSFCFVAYSGVRPGILYAIQICDAEAGRPRRYCSPSPVVAVCLYRNHAPAAPAALTAHTSVASILDDSRRYLRNRFLTLSEAASQCFINCAVTLSPFPPALEAFCEANPKFLHSKDMWGTPKSLKGLVYPSENPCPHEPMCEGKRLPLDEDIAEAINRFIVSTAISPRVETSCLVRARLATGQHEGQR